MTPKHRVLFLCTGNAARSQMAEGLVNALLGERWTACSAGTHPTGQVHPLAVRAMAEIGIDISQQRSKPVSVWHGQTFDVVVTVCDEAAAYCPRWQGSGKVIHFALPDPAAIPGDEATQLEAFRKVRDTIREQLLPLLQALAGEPGG